MNLLYVGISSNQALARRSSLENPVELRMSKRLSQKQSSFDYPVNRDCAQLSELNQSQSDVSLNKHTVRNSIVIAKSSRCKIILERCDASEEEATKKLLDDNESEAQYNNVNHIPCSEGQFPLLPWLPRTVEFTRNRNYTDC